MKSQFIFAFAALLMIASLILEGDCFTGPVQGKRTMQICRAARSLGCRNIEQEEADDPMKEGRTRRERTMQICRTARSLGCRNIEQEVADDPIKEGRARREVRER
ncbi:unnamed protein product [Porites evermanni]|uniref:Uncharacterized protein n=1 Tax=Porites evermanni TaxID=104178 RepID=A0ABN8MQR1_9CNID|nr:unnamed protein product [Porites evermanni]